MASGQERKEMDSRGKEGEMVAAGAERKEMDNRAKEGETVVPGGTGGKSLTAQERLAEGRSKGGQTRKEQLGKEGYQEMGRKGGFSNYGMSGVGADEEGIHVDESKFHTNKEGTQTDESKFRTMS